jgi:hypothetical protein
VTLDAKHWQQSFSGQVIYPRALTSDAVRLEDIGHALAQKVRFAGQATVMGYSVAQHCVLGSAQVPPPFRLPFLLHELGEVYLPDIPTPLKNSLFVLPGTGEGFIPWREIEQQHERAILKAIGLERLTDQIHSPEVRECDVRMLLTEKRDLLGPEPQPWGFKAEPYPFKIVDIWEPVWAEEQFNRAFSRLKHQRNGT